jgi:feruloyl esterase
MNHCSGGPAIDSFDMLTAIQNWVEKGAAPDAVLAKAGPTTPWVTDLPTRANLARQRARGSGSI